MSEDVKQVGTQFASDYLTSVKNNAVSNLTDDDDNTGAVSYTHLRAHET